MVDLDADVVTLIETWLIDIIQMKIFSSLLTVFLQIREYFTLGCAILVRASIKRTRRRDLELLRETLWVMFLDLVRQTY